MPTVTLTVESIVNPQKRAALDRILNESHPTAGWLLWRVANIARAMNPLIEDADDTVRELLEKHGAKRGEQRGGLIPWIFPNEAAESAYSKEYSALMREEIQVDITPLPWRASRALAMDPPPSGYEVARTWYMWEPPTEGEMPPIPDEPAPGEGDDEVDGGPRPRSRARRG